MMRLVGWLLFFVQYRLKSFRMKPIIQFPKMSLRMKMSIPSTLVINKRFTKNKKIIGGPELTTSILPADVAFIGSYDIHKGFCGVAKIHFRVIKLR